MSLSFEIIIATPEREVFRATAQSITIPTTTGQITVLPNHVPLSTVLAPGELIIRADNLEQPYAVSGGFVEVQPRQVVILADTAEHVTEIDEQRAQEAIARAQKNKEAMREDQVEYAATAAKLERDLNRLRVVKKHRHQAHHGIMNEGVRKD